ncbi:MAG: RNA polymerase sigma factor [Candidatus Krumholzibacteria bacterium]|nr:RNA polymerase sigma factor [Candidatus Krumholzibacteria bacterium]
MKEAETEEIVNVEAESKSLVKAFLSGEKRAFDRLIVLHQRMVFSLCFRLLGEYDEADDAAQEVFIKVHRHIGGFRFESSFRTWIYRVTVNTCRNRMDTREYRMKKKKVSIEKGPSYRDGDSPVDIPDRSESPLGAITRKEVGRMIQGAIDLLSGEQKMVVVLKDIQGRSYEEIVDMTGLKMGTVKSKLSRGRLKLRELLQGKIDD